MTHHPIERIETRQDLAKTPTSFRCSDCRNAHLFLEDSKLICEKCKNSKPVINGIPRLVNLDNYSESFGYQWNIHAATQLDSHSKLPISEERINKVTGWYGKSLKGQKILEAGSGAGRFTEVILKTDGDLYSFDYSNAVEANAKNNKGAKNLNLFQGDIFNIPFEDYYFDHVLCLGVIQHTPDPERAFYELAKKVMPGGFLYIDVYTRSWYHLLAWKYVLRPVTKRMGREKLYNIIKVATPHLIPITKLLRKLFGRAGARLMPIVEYSHLQLAPKLNEEWAICDTFDMYSPAHDHPQSMKSVKKWFENVGFEEVEVWYGDNGVVGRGKRPKVKE